ncbi:riboflavin synthase [Persephonella atlantica]|uniref:Riboflavin synthase n=1 Tax=Persephonella atlantica TaxID=2699429 RepID=A0ABS1GIY1_9AQUI|nr:riboflavin synthase [Persephonella atlantica]MBK3332887.1 riboflavin synthase [Persephonella atlantica]
MFTGLIEEVGTVKSVKPVSGGKEIGINAYIVTEDTNIGDSISVNGVCLTVTAVKGDTIFFDVSQESLDRSNLKFLAVGDKVNLERALKISDRLGGHIVQGHVDTVGIVERITPKGEHTEFIISFPPQFTDLIVEKGSIAIDGISLTINSIDKNRVSINVIPHTLHSTNLTFKKAGDSVNIEFDILGKYIKRILGKSTGRESHLEKLLENF